MPPRGKGRCVPLVVTAAYYTFSGRLYITNVIETPALEFKSQPINAFFGAVGSQIGFDYRALGSSRKLAARAAEHLIEGSKKCICRLRFVCY